MLERFDILMFVVSVDQLQRDKVTQGIWLNRCLLLSQSEATHVGLSILLAGHKGCMKGVTTQPECLDAHSHNLFVVV